MQMTPTEHVILRHKADIEIKRQLIGCIERGEVSFREDNGSGMERLDARILELTRTEVSELEGRIEGLRAKEDPAEDR